VTLEPVNWHYFGPHSVLIVTNISSLLVG